MQPDKIEKRGTFNAINPWDTIRWMFNDLIGSAYKEIMADTIMIDDVVAVRPKPREGAETSVPEQKVTVVGRVTEVNFADSGKGGNGPGWLIKVRDDSGPGTTLENLYATDSYDFFLVTRPGEDEDEDEE